MWGRLSTLQNTINPDGFVDKSYVKLSTKRVFTAMVLHVFQSIVLSVLWFTTRSTWSILMNIPFTLLETAWFANEIRKGWGEVDQTFWTQQSTFFGNAQTSQLVENVEPMFLRPDVSINGITDTVEQLLEDIDELEPMHIEDLSFLSREK